MTVARRTVIALAVVAVLISAIGTVQLADPNGGTSPSQPIESDTSAAEIATVAVNQLRHSDYRFIHNRTYANVSTPRIDRMKVVSNTDRAFLMREQSSSGEATVYGNDAVGYIRYSKEGRWQLDSSAYYKPSTNVVASPEPIKTADIAMIEETDQTVVIEVRDTTSANALVAPGFLNPNAEEATVKLTVRRADGRITRMERVARDSELEPSRWTDVGRFSYGETVTRPNSIGFSLSELGWDLARGPLFTV